MLGSIRKFSTSIYSKVLLVIIIIPFVFWGMGSSLSGGNKNIIVIIDKDKYVFQNTGTTGTIIDFSDSMILTKNSSFTYNKHILHRIINIYEQLFPNTINLNTVIIINQEVIQE